MTYANLIAASHYVPNNRVTNDDLANILDTNDEWIHSRTGIRARHISQGQNTSDLAAQVGQQLLGNASWDPASLDFIIVATMTPDSVMPSAASLVQAKLGATNAFAYDLTAACSGFIFALATAEKLIKGGYKRGMVIGAETLSKVVDWQDRSTAVLFGDGAGGVLLDNTGTQPLIISESLMTDGAGGQALTAQESLVDNPFSKRARDNAQYLAMDGRAVFDFAIRQVPKNIQAVLDQADVAADEVDYYVLHQANSRILDKIARKLKVDRNLLLQNMDNYGNTSAASVPILLSESLQAGTVQLGSGQKVMLAGFGGGLTWGSLLLSL